jgi:TRAP-type uncharacterized transport system substrate-binding protein
MRLALRHAAMWLILGAVLPALLCGCGGHKQMLSVVSAGSGGVYYPLGGGLANLLTGHLPGYQVTSEVTGGSVDNLKRRGADAETA